MNILMPPQEYVNSMFKRIDESCKSDYPITAKEYKEAEIYLETLMDKYKLVEVL